LLLAVFETLGRYISPDIDQDAVLEEHSDELPVVDLGRLVNPESWEQEAAKLKMRSGKHSRPESPKFPGFRLSRPGPEFYFPDRD
jgi:hypothetical protein